MIEITCKQCGKKFLVNPGKAHDGKGHFCSVECARENMRTGEMVTCLQCGKRFYVSKNQLDRGRGKFCSKDCYQRHWSETIAPSFSSRARKRVERTCVVCGKKFSVIASWTKQKGGGKYCSRACKYEGQRRVTGANHPLYKEIPVLTCEFCGKKYKPSRYAEVEKSRFCSRKCQGSYTVQNVKSPTSIERKVSEMLSALAIRFETEVQIGQFLCDFYIPDHKAVIEADGTYWHSLPKMKRADKAKGSYLTKRGYALLRLPEKLINESPDTCIALISRLIDTSAS